MNLLSQPFDAPMPALRPNRFLAHMRSGQIEHLYCLGNFASPRHVDFICGSGSFHSLWFDLEHFDLPIQELAVLNLVARAYPVTTIARFRATDYQTVMRVMETRIGGIFCAMVESADEARQIVSWAKFNNPSPGPGEVVGIRGWNGGGIDAAYGTLPVSEYVRHQNTEVPIICQVETKSGVRHLDEIAAVPGVDGLFFGPGDYAHRIGLVGQPCHPEVISVMHRINESCQRQGKFWGTVSADREHYRQVRALGAKFIGAGNDVRMMKFGLREIVKSFAE